MTGEVSARGRRVAALAPTPIPNFFAESDLKQDREQALGFSKPRPLTARPHQRVVAGEGVGARPRARAPEPPKALEPAGHATLAKAHKRSFLRRLGHPAGRAPAERPQLVPAINVSRGHPFRVLRR